MLKWVGRCGAAARCVGERVRVAARARNRRVARDPLWEPADETRDVTLQLHSGPFL